MVRVVIEVESGGLKAVRATEPEALVVFLVDWNRDVMGQLLAVEELGVEKPMDVHQPAIGEPEVGILK